MEASGPPGVGLLLSVRQSAPRPVHSRLLRSTGSDLCAASLRPGLGLEERGGAQRGGCGSRRGGAAFGCVQQRLFGPGRAGESGGCLLRPLRACREVAVRLAGLACSCGLRGGRRSGAWPGLAAGACLRRRLSARAPGLGRWCGAGPRLVGVGPPGAAAVWGRGLWVGLVSAAWTGLFDAAANCGRGSIASSASAAG